MISFSQAAFKILSLLLSVNSMIMVCLSVDLFEFILLGFHWASWIFNLIFLKKIKFVEFSAVISSEMLSFLFYLSFTFEILIMCMLVCKMVFHSSLRFCSFFLIIFFCSLDLRNSIGLYSTELFLSYVSSNLMLNSSSEFFISVL